MRKTKKLILGVAVSNTSEIDTAGDFLQNKKVLRPIVMHFIIFSIFIMVIDYTQHYQ